MLMYTTCTSYKPFTSHYTSNAYPSFPVINKGKESFILFFEAIQPHMERAKLLKGTCVVTAMSQCNCMLTQKEKKATTCAFDIILRLRT